MLKALFRKQLRETLNLFTAGRKKKADGKKKDSVTTAVVLIFVYMMVAVIFFGLADSICAPMTSAGLGWFYFDLMSLVGMVLAVFGSVFSTYASLYQAKDNELLLSMPIPPGYILLARMFTVYAIGTFFLLLVMLPALVLYFIYAELTFSMVLGSILMLIAESLFALILSCILGFVVAAISSRMKNKSIGTAILSLIFLAVYFVVYFKATASLTNITENSAAMAASVQENAAILYHLGMAAEGDLLSALIILLITAALAVVAYRILSRSFIGIATRNRGNTKVKYKEKPVKQQSINSALLNKELKRFAGSSTYMLNGALGSLLMIVSAIAAIIWAAPIREAMDILSWVSGDYEPTLLLVVAVAATAMFASMSVISAPSVSLEGHSLWVLQSLPAPAGSVLWAKIKLQLLIVAIPNLLLALVLVFVLKLPLISAILLIAFTATFNLLLAAAGLLLGLKMPVLDWTNESVAVKQSISVVFVMFGGWLLIAVIAALYFIFFLNFSAVLYILIWLAIIILADLAMIRLVNTKGVEMFRSL